MWKTKQKRVVGSVPGTLSALVAVLLTLPCHDSKAPQPGLEAYIGKDLRRLDWGSGGIIFWGPPSGPHTTEFWTRFQDITGDMHDPKDRLEPWWVERFRSGKASWMFLEAYPGHDIPDWSGVRVHLLDRHWKQFATQAFPTGYRFFLKEARVVRNAVVKTDLLVTRVDSSGPFVALPGGVQKPAFEQGAYQRQYYALLDGKLVLVRLEDDESRPIRNSYRWRDPPKGPPVPKRTAGQWLRSLRSADAVEQLATLLWLTGAHLSSSDPRASNANQESPEASRIFEEVRALPETRRALSELKKAMNPWVRQYAQLGLVPADE